MSRSRTLRRVAVCLAAVTALLAVNVASASAATWSTASSLKVTGNVTFETSSGEQVSCQVDVTKLANGYEAIPFNCPKTKPGWTVRLAPLASGIEGKMVYAVSFYGSAVMTISTSPFSGSYSWYYPSTQAVGSFTNGNASESSYITLDGGFTQGGKAHAGTVGTSSGSQSLYLKGKLNVTTPTGGLVTIVP